MYRRKQELAETTWSNMGSYLLIFLKWSSTFFF